MRMNTTSRQDPLHRTRPLRESSQPARRTVEMYIDGAWVPARSGATFIDLNPATGEPWAEVADGGPEDAVAALEAAAAAREAWAALPHTQRARYLLKVADILESRIDEVAEALACEGGGWHGKGMFEGGYAPDIYRAAAASAWQTSGEVLPSGHGKLSLAIREPLGVVSVISPWNFPLLLSSRGLAFALAIGNTIVLKPSEETPYSGGALICEALEEAGVPPGVCNLLTCSRNHVADVGDVLVTHPLVDAISFTGSTAIGKLVAGKAGSLLKKVCVELGGKDALLILDDADMERAVAAATFGAFLHQGQLCMSAERILVDATLADEFLERFLAKTRTLPMGNPSVLANVIGPIINERQIVKIVEQVDDAVARGARLLIGGRRDGLFFPPTILSGVTRDMKIFREETFGPVAPVTVVNGEEEAIALANDSEYGLSAGIITADEQRGLRVARRLRTGMAHINDCPVYDEPHVPFGGAKNSGFGRHGGRWSTETFSETRWITLERGGREYPF
jgi:aldehyde dehydrogenase (NAD+)